MILWLRLCTSAVGGVGSIPGQRTKIPYAGPKKKKKKERERDNCKRTGIHRKNIMMS